MRRSNIAFILSLVIHAIVAVILVTVHKDAIVRQGSKTIDVEFNVVAPQPKIEPRKPKIEPIDLNPTKRTTDTDYSSRLIKLTTDQKMANVTTYRTFTVNRRSDTPIGLGMPDDNVSMDRFSDGAGRGRRAGPVGRNKKSQLEEFVDKARGVREVIYCLDVSASMGVSNKLNLARNYLRDSLIALNEQDKFNIICFSKDMDVFRSDMTVQATRENVSEAVTFLGKYTPESIQANTKTDLSAVLTVALEMKPSIIALVTDGLPTAGIINPEKLIQSISEKNTSGTKIFAIGMEMDLEQPETWLMKAIAEQNNGEFQFF